MAPQPEHRGKVMCVSELRWELVLVTMAWRVHLPAYQVTFAGHPWGYVAHRYVCQVEAFENPGWEPPGLGWSILEMTQTTQVNLD